MKKLLLFFLMIIMFVSCKESPKSDHNKESVSRLDKEKAAAYHDQALDLRINSNTQEDSIRKVIRLLDSAIRLDPDNMQPYFLKLSYQTWMGEYESALETIHIIEKQKPNNPDLKSREGFLNLMLDNDQTATIAMTEADSLWEIQLDTIASDNDWGLLGILSGKAMNLKLLGRENQAEELYRRILEDPIFDKPKYEEVKKVIDSQFLKQSREDLFRYIKQRYKPVKHRAT